MNAHLRATRAWSVAAGDDVHSALGKLELHKRQDGRCYLCGGYMLLHVPPTACYIHNRATRDHVFPQARGGDGFANVLLAGARCNTDKGSRWPYPCEVIFLAAVYTVRSTASARAQRRHRRWAERR